MSAVETLRATIKLIKSRIISEGISTGNLYILRILFNITDTEEDRDREFI